MFVEYIFDWLVFWGIFIILKTFWIGVNVKFCFVFIIWFLFFFCLLEFNVIDWMRLIWFSFLVCGVINVFIRVIFFSLLSFMTEDNWMGWLLIMLSCSILMDWSFTVFRWLKGILKDEFVLVVIIMIWVLFLIWFFLSFNNCSWLNLVFCEEFEVFMVFISEFCCL